MVLQPGDKLDEQFSGLACAHGLMTVAGFGSLLSQKSARSTFPELINFRLAVIRGWRRVFSHTAAIFWTRGIARPETSEISSLSCEEEEEEGGRGQAIWVVLFEVPATPQSIAAFVEREHEFRFVAVQPFSAAGEKDRLAVLCARWDDESYKAQRCPPAEWQARYGRVGIRRVWRTDVLPCRCYLRHCVLAARGLNSLAALASFLDNTFLARLTRSPFLLVAFICFMALLLQPMADRQTTVRMHLERNPDIMKEEPPYELRERYSG